jgi:drug/metabolite transporter superfamily protein YnfA
MTNIVSWSIFLLAAILEIGGDAVIRKGLRGSGYLLISAGFIMLGCYGLVVNTVKWDFSKLLGVYIAFFAVMTIVVSRVLLREDVSTATWVGMAVIVCGGLIIQFGQR